MRVPLTYLIATVLFFAIDMAWLGFFAPAGTPRDIRVKLAAEISTIMQTKDMQDRLVGMGAGPMWGTVDQFETYFREEGTRFAKVIKAANVKMD